jgi:glycosyltransferase involved in cell wall biosynthesis
MKIGIDIRTLEDNAQHRGIGRYATKLIEALSETDHVNEYTFICSKESVILPKFQLNKKFKYAYAALNNQFIRERRYIRILFVTRKPVLLDILALDSILQLDVSYPLIFGKIPIASVLYDLIPLIYKSTYQKVELKKASPGHILAYTRQKAFWFFTNRQIFQYLKSAAIISISHHSAKDLKKYIPKLNMKKIHVTHLSATKLPVPTNKAKKQFKELGLNKLQYIVYVGGLDPRKGLMSLVKDYSEVRKQYPNLLLVLGGKEFNDDKVLEARELNKLIAQLGIHDNVIRVSELSDELMGLLYSHATVSVLPSRYEGFGLPVLDAMQAGCPIICYDNSSLPEVAGNAAIIVKDGEPMIQEIINVVKDKKLQKELYAKGLLQAAKFSWERTASETVKILEEIAK